MPISDITNGEGGLSVRTKLNNVIDLANDVEGNTAVGRAMLTAANKAAQKALVDVDDVEAAATAETAARIAADTAETTARTAADTALDAAKADKTVTISAAGVATGGGNLSANRTVTVTQATRSTLRTGTATNEAVTPFTLGGAVSPRIDDSDKFNLALGDLEVKTEVYNWDAAVLKKASFGGDPEPVYYGIKAGKFWHPDVALERDRRNRAYSASVMNNPLTLIAHPIPGDNAVVENGQSKATGSEGWPAKSVTNVSGNFMPGNDYRSTQAVGWGSLGGTFNHTPLVAQVIGGGAVLNDAAVAALAEGASNEGETPGVGCINLFNRMFCQRMRLATSGTYRFLYANVAQGGRELGELAKGHTFGSTEYYGRYFDFLTDSNTFSTAASRAHQILFLLIGQGETESLGASVNPDVAKNQAEYEEQFGDWHDDHVADALALAGNTKAPAWIYFQIGEGYTQDADMYGYPTMSVQQAQLYYGLRNRQTAFCVGPHYPYTDKGGNHMDANGYRWAGLKAGMVAVRTVLDRLSWQPLHMIATELHGDILYVHYHVPVPPLQWGITYRNGVAQNFSDRGFRVTDSTGALTISDVQLAGPTTVSMKLNRRPFPNGKVWYADKSVHLGHGNLCDSEIVDPTYVYEYDAGSGDYTSANIAALVNQPYDMRNFAVQQVEQIGWEMALS